MALAPSTLNYMIGKGKVYFDRFDANGSTGELDLGNDPDFSNTPTVEELDHYSSMAGIKTKDKSATVSADITLKFTLDEPNTENLNLMFLGEPVTNTLQADGIVTAEDITAHVGRWIKLKYRNIVGATVVVTTVGGGVTYVLNTDYQVDTSAGRIYIVPSGNIGETEALEVDYYYGSVSYPTINPMSASSIEGLIRFIGDCTHGCNYEVIYWKVKIKPTGDFKFIGEDWTTITLEAEVLDDSANHPTHPKGMIVNLTDAIQNPES